MTKEDAVNILEEVKEIDDSMFQYSEAYMTALDMAIEALREQKTVICRCKDCKYFSDDDVEAVCHAHGINLTDRNGFCWLGEKGIID